MKKFLVFMTIMVGFQFLAAYAVHLFGHSPSGIGVNIGFIFGYFARILIAHFKL